MHSHDSNLPPVETRASSGKRSASDQALWAIALSVWAIIVCWVPDPRPFGAPQWAVDACHNLFHMSEATARVATTLAFRATAYALLGALVACASCAFSLRWTLVIGLVGGPLLAIVCQRINYGYFPVLMQSGLASVSALLGCLVAVGLQRNPWALLAALLFTSGLFAWGTSTGISDDLEAASASVVQHLLQESSQFPKGDEGFTQIVQEAFSYAQDNSHRQDAAFANRAAILALGVLLGDKHVATVARRQIPPEVSTSLSSFRKGITLRGRNDLARHFWVSASLTLLTDKERSISVGIGKELLDANPGGSGFSFVDLMADQAGVRFATLATAKDATARNLQLQIAHELTADDFCPPIESLPEGIGRDAFQSDFGGLRGAGTKALVEEIQLRLQQCAALQPAQSA